MMLAAASEPRSSTETAGSTHFLGTGHKVVRKPKWRDSIGPGTALTAPGPTGGTSAR
jgi:hypothetical protein